MRTIIDGRLTATEKELGETHLPRIIRLCRKFKLSKKDTEIALYKLMEQSGGDKERPLVTHKDVCAPGVHHKLEVPFLWFLEFFEKDKPHIVQEILECQEWHVLYNFEYKIEVFKGIIGMQLKPEEFMKLDCTQVADVIKEEPGDGKLR